MKVLIVGCGGMGSAHAKAYQKLAAMEICGLVSTGTSKEALQRELRLPSVPLFTDINKALKETCPDCVCISTFPDTHAPFAKIALEAGCHVFVEKPLATTVVEAEEIVHLARQKGTALVVGYILRQHPSWQRFVSIANKELGRPLIMRMNLNQQSRGATWDRHCHMIADCGSPVVDCGVHYVDVMCQMVRPALPTSIHAIGARLSADIPSGTFNYGQLQLCFSDGSLGWYEAGWGPMMSETAHFIKDVIGPCGSVSIKANFEAHASDAIEGHTRTESLLLHKTDGTADQWIDMQDEPDHNELCLREQRFFLDAIEGRVDLEDHLQDAINSLRIVMAADESMRTGQTVRL